MARNRTFFIAGTVFGVIVAFVLYRYLGTQVPQKPAVTEDRHQEEKHEAEGHEHEGKVVKLHQKDIHDFGIVIKEAGPGKLTVQVELPGEVMPNADRLLNVVPRVPGIASTVSAHLGDYVQAGETLAILESKELADTKAAYLAALKRREMAETSLKREEMLFQKKISPEMDYLDAKKVFDEAQIELKSTGQKLHSIGFSEAYLAALPSQPGTAFTRYELKAPFSGTVIEKHITFGSVLKDDTVAFVIADMSTVWANINVYQKDMASLRKGQAVVVSAGGTIPDVKGTVSYISSVTAQETRTATARVVLPNPKGLLRPGLFVTAKLAVDEVSVPLLIPKTALASEGGKAEVFVQTGEGFKPQAVTLGRSSDTHAEVVSGLKPGEKYVAKGGFTLKAQLSKGAFGDGHNH